MACKIEAADCITWLLKQPAKSLNLTLGSPPYEDARSYGGLPSRRGQDWVDWMVECTRAAVHATNGLVAWVVEGKTKDYRWSATPALLMADLHRAGFCLRKPPLYMRAGIPGSGGPDWLKNQYEFIVCITPPGRLPWSDPLAFGHPPKYHPGGPLSYRDKNDVRKTARRHTKRTSTDEMEVQQYTPPKLANPGNIIYAEAGEGIHSPSGGGNMGHKLAHENEAPFGLKLAEFFVKTFCPPGGVVCDPFSGSGSTAHAALLQGRQFRGCDLRQSQVDLTTKRLEDVQCQLSAVSIPASMEPSPCGTEP